tara:strand:- start:349 stop:807 length:459 start_codon:yes stop_codon:yes gene_type:complete
MVSKVLSRLKYMRMKIQYLLQKRHHMKPFKLGFFGECIAAKYLWKNKGMRILVRNWRHGRDEVDLVCMDDEVLVFVEVKTRTDAAIGTGYFAVDRRKKRALLRACRRYISHLKLTPPHFRFDIVEVISGIGKVPLVNHHVNVKLFSRHYHGH